MKRLMTMISLVFLGLIATSCYDDAALWESLNDQEQRIKTLEDKCEEMNGNISALQDLLAASNSGDLIVSVTPVMEGEAEVGYTLTFASGKTVTIYHGKDGADGKTPQIGAAAYEGVLYWTLNGEFMLDSEGNKIPVEGTAGKTPELKIEDGVWYVSYDGTTWETISVAVEGEAALYISITYDENYVYINLSSGETLMIARSKGLDVIFPEGNKVNFYPGELFSIPYEIVGGDENTQISALTGNGWTAVIKATDASKGYVEVTAPPYHLNGEVVVLVSDGLETTIMRTLVFNEGELNIVADSYDVGAEATSIDITLTTNLNYYIALEGGADWITFPEDTKSDLREESFTVNIAENTSYEPRVATIYLINNNYYIINRITIYQHGKPYDAWYMVGTFNDWTTLDEAYKMTRDGDWFVMKNFTTDDASLKFNIGSWDVERTGIYLTSDRGILLNTYGDNMSVPAGTYDVYLDKDAVYAYFMTPGLTPGEIADSENTIKAGEYWLSVGGQLAVPLAEDKSYGYISVTDFIWSDNGIMTSYVDNVLTFAEVEGGFTIKDSYGRYLYQKGDYNSFNVSTELPESGYVWTVELNDDGTATITNAAVNKFIQYSLTYGSFGSYAEFNPETNVMPTLLPAVCPIDPDATEDPETGSWSLIGSFNEWNGDEFFVADTSGYLVVKDLYMPAGTEFKLRYNSSWDKNRGAAEAGEIVLGEPIPLYENGQNMTIAAEGYYDFYFDEANDQLTVVKVEEEDGEEEDSVVTATVAEFLAAAEDDTWYQLTGKIANLNNTTYGNFDIVDATGSVYVYGLTATMVEKNDKSFSTLGLEEGDIVTIIGKRSSYSGVAQVGGPAYYVCHEGYTVATVADFLAAAEDDTWYMLTGVVANVANTTYGNFDLIDETDTVYVYGLTAAPVAKNDKTYASLGIAEGDVVTLVGKRSSYKGEAQVGGPAYYISHVAAAVEGDFEGDGLTAETAYTVADAIAYYNAGMDSGTAVWVKGEIIGSYQSNALLEGSEGASSTNIAIGTAEANIPVQLPKGDVRTALNLSDNPSNVGKTVALYGTIEAYFSVAGLKGVSDYVLE